jgi:uncharacterized RDD family membrane protein YckC
MVKAIDLLGNNSQMQNHWARRLIAIIIDAIIIVVIWVIIRTILFTVNVIIPGFWYWTIEPFFQGLIWLGYSILLEAVGGATLGKRILNLRVVSTEGPMDFTKAVIRNITKIHGLLLLIDWLVGIITDGDPRQRYMDRISNTTVIRTDVQEVFMGAFQPPGGPMPMPYQAGPQPQPGAQPAYGPEVEAGAQPEPAEQPSAGAEATEAVEPTAEVTTQYTREELVNMRKDDLVKICRSQNLKTTGTKRDLIDRILGEKSED